MSSRTEISHFQELLIGHFDPILNKLSQYYPEIPAKPNADGFEKEWYIDKPHNQSLHHMSLLSPANDASRKSQEM
jgi:hypothetical protein